MGNVLFINYMGEGHINPTIGLVQELIARGESITYYTSQIYKEKIEKTGATVRVISEKAQKILFEFVTKLMSQGRNLDQFNKNRFKLFEIMEWITDEILDEIRLESYDYVIYDAMSLPGKWIAEIRQLPTVCTWSTFASNKESDLFKKRLKKQGSAILKALDGRKEEMEAFKARLEQKYGISIQPFPQAVMDEADINIVFTSKYFQLESATFKENFLFVGPSMIDRQDQGDFPLDRLKDSAVVYMALGTIANKRPDLYKACLEGLNDFDGTVVLGIGNQLSISELGSVPDHFIIRNYIPQLDVLRYSDAFITHCGMNSTSEALYFGTPLVMLPLMNDQPIVANRVKELGAGVILDHETLNAEKLREAVIEVLQNPIYKQNSEKISQSFRKSGGCARAADELLSRIKQFV
ncbi:macrolide family glycosyltransferase [Seinonella peptonophila]|uniref:macrolide family glycosyltransferase n=1 Tax=Seinonella peptonophila TaxID=112248 RepID=UPI001114C81D|nr:macrolide family glycosyltransferase [Seinonella peptonophila]